MMGEPTRAEMLSEKKLKVLAERIGTAASNLDALSAEMAQYLAPTINKANSNIKEQTAPEATGSQLTDTLGVMIGGVESLINKVLDIRERLR